MYLFHLVASQAIIILPYSPLSFWVSCSLSYFLPFFGELLGHKSGQKMADDQHTNNAKASFLYSWRITRKASSFLCSYLPNDKKKNSHRVCLSSFGFHSRRTQEHVSWKSKIETRARYFFSVLLPFCLCECTDRWGKEDSGWLIGQTWAKQEEKRKEKVQAQRR